MLRRNWCKNAARNTDALQPRKQTYYLFLLLEFVICRRLYIPCRTEFVWSPHSHRFDSRGVYGRWKTFDSIDLLPSYQLSDAPQLLCKSDYKSDSSRYVMRTSRNMLKLWKMLKWTLSLRFSCCSRMRQPRFHPHKPTTLTAVASPSCESFVSLHYWFPEATAAGQ